MRKTLHSVLSEAPSRTETLIYKAIVPLIVYGAVIAAILYY